MADLLKVQLRLGKFSDTALSTPATSVNVPKNVIKRVMRKSAYKPFAGLEFTASISAKASKHINSSSEGLVAPKLVAAPTKTCFSTMTAYSIIVRNGFQAPASIEWSCSACTLQNDALRLNCELCFSKRPVVNTNGKAHYGRQKQSQQVRTAFFSCISSKFVLKPYT